MLSRSTPFRLLLTLLIACWPSVCFCQTAERGPGAEREPECCGMADDDSGSSCTCCGSGEGPQKHTHGPGCDCSGFAGAITKAGPVQVGALAGDAISHPVLAEVMTLIATVRSAILARADLAPPRPPTSLLRLHCALTT